MVDEKKLPKGWQIKRLGEVGKIVSGGTPSTSNPEFWNGGVSWITPADLSGYKEKYISKGRKSITDVGLKNSSARIIPKGSVLFSSRAPIGYVVISANDVCTNQGFKSIIPNKETSSEYLFYFLKASKASAEKVASGTTFKEISLKNFSELSIPCPPLLEQLKIVCKIEQLFSELDKAKENLEIAQQQLKVFRQAVLKYAFEGKLTNKKVKEGELPKGWKMGKLEDVCEITSSRRIFQEEYVNSGIPFFRTKEIKELSEGKELSIELFISKEKYAEIKSKNDIPKIDDILLSAVGTIGISYVIKDNKPFYFKDGNLIWLKNLNGIKSKFLNYQLAHFIKYKQDIATSGSAYNALTIIKLKSFTIPIPLIKEQEQIIQEIESRLSVCDKMEETITQSLLQSETLRQSILKKAFEGKLI